MRSGDPMTKVAALIFLFSLIAYGIAEMGWGGGDPNDPRHNRSDRYG